MSAGSGLNETALYGIVTTIYFSIFMYRYNKGQIVTDKRAMFNITMVFMFAQPLCRYCYNLRKLPAYLYSEILSQYVFYYSETT